MPHTSDSILTPKLCFTILIGLTLVRLIGLHFSTVDLFYDEAQYWLWSLKPAFGYFSKPPLLAWIIALSNTVCGDSEACTRSSSPIFYLGISLVCYAIAKLLYGERAAVWTALAVALAAGVAFSSRVISTDVPLLFFWSAALYAYFKLLRDGSIRWGILLGLALGLGLLAKYAMIYFLLGVAMAALVDADARKILRQPALWLALAITALLIAPNIAWNLTNGLQTFRHTGDNIQGEGGFHFSILKGLEFFVTQFAVLGPIVFGALLVIIFQFRYPDITREDRLLISFAIPPIALITTLAFFRGAYGNWAATSFISAAIVVTAVMVRRNEWRWLFASLSIGIVAQIILLAGDAYATRLTIPALGKNADIYQKSLNGRTLGQAVARIARQTGSRTIVAEEIYEVSLLHYYVRNEKVPVFIWPSGKPPESHYDVNNVIPKDAAQPILLISQCPEPARVRRYFDGVAPLGMFDMRTGPTSRRTYAAFTLTGPRVAPGPLGPCM